MSQFSMDLSSFDNIWAEIYSQYDWLVQADYLDKSNLLKVENFNIVGFFKSIVEYAMYELNVSFSQFKMILIFLLVIALFQNIQTTFSTRYEKITNTVLKLILIVQLFGLFVFYHDYTLDILTRYMDIVVAVFPILLSMITITGALWNHALFQPAVVFLINVSYFFINAVSLPLTVIGTIFGFVNQIGIEDLYSRLTNFINKIALWTLGGYFAFFLTLMSIQNVTLSFADGLFFRTTQTLMNYIPVIGSRFTDTVVSIISTLSIMRNSVGLLSIITLVIFVSFPIVKLGIATILFRLLTAIIQPLVSKDFINVLDIFNTGVMNLLVITIIIAVMFIFTFFIILYSSNMMLVTN
ncbi:MULTISPECIES: stage III sporulation protein AE [Turicibacter]|jgi:putative stage III sporulation protein AE|uniref:Stage III sporulation protein AE n=4 Tax=Turicibacter sanguinis TaxID=154288 RepID=A0A173SXJ2_9FIRM|nr:MULTISPECIES: stage III sporulation protein AE [Turicibacter]EFF65033.1 putative stage III sporulation protein AE [Turicibacter sanguinis PC909]EGC90775.1 putative stage III sporulation protein AE [Turicibacter sp. HGF1]MCU7191629.1 stage III sporulation protein AE [Turicibacter sanguinis]MCU7196705.1 stage III sporulation protein AE [Turicibacter sanguinis]MCU7201984.1 stage III sporulation protein AE [Turicibacter sanguinis]